MTFSVKRFASHLTHIELWAVAFFVALSMAVPRLLPLALVVAASFWIIRLVAHGRLSVRTPSDWSNFLIVAMIPVTLLITPLPEVTKLQLMRLLSGIALFYAVVNWASSIKRLKLIAIGLGFTGLVLAIAAPLSVEWYAAKLVFAPALLYDRFLILVSDTIHPNVLAGTLIILLPIPLAQLVFNWQGSPWWERLFNILTSILVLFVLVLTQARGAWITLVLLIMTIFLMRWRRGWIVLIAAVLAGVVAIVVIGTDTLFQALLSDTTLYDLNGRIEIWSRAIFMLQDFPYTGIGMGAFDEMVTSLYPIYNPVFERANHAHNLILQVGVDLGFLGMISWFSIYLVTTFISLHIYWRGRSADNGIIIGMGAGLFLSQLALIIHGSISAVTWGMVRPAPLVWVIWGTAAACHLILPGLLGNISGISGEAIESKID